MNTKRANENKNIEDLVLEMNEYSVQRGKMPIMFYLSKTKNYIIIRSISYELKMTLNDFSLMTGQMYRSIDEVYQFLKNIFEKKNVKIQDISNKMMTLTISFFDATVRGVNEVIIYLPGLNGINGYVLNELFTKIAILGENLNILNERNNKLNEENIKMKEENNKIKEENAKIKEENAKFRNDMVKIKNDIIFLQKQNKKKEEHINLLIDGIDKINNFIDNRPTNTPFDENDEINNSNSTNNLKIGIHPEDVKKSLSLTKSQQNLNSKRNNFYKTLNTNYSTQTSPNFGIKMNSKNEIENDTDNNENYPKDLNIYGEEQLFRTEEGRVIFRNGILNGIIKKYAEINNVVNRIQERLKKGAKFRIAYKAIEMGDKASTFHQKCDNLKMSLIIIETQKGIRFGGFTKKLWKGNCVQKIDNDAFVFSIDKNKIYDIITNENAIGCYPKFGPVFFGCQIRIYDKFFTKNSTTCHRGLNYKTNQDYELNNGEQIFFVKDLEVYEIETIDMDI
jgi:hypothetical protein